MKTPSVLILLLCCYTLSWSQVENPPGNDFFPLRVGLTRLYSYKSSETLYETIALSKYTTDSGYVKFSVLSKTINDIVIVWQIQERDSVLRVVKDYLKPPYPKDTLFMVVNISNFGVSEKTSGMHELIGSSSFLLWQFPSHWQSYTQVGPPVYRYSNDSTKRIPVNNLYIHPYDYHDSLMYYRNIGIISARYSIVRTGAITPYYFDAEAHLLDPPVSVEEYPHPAAPDFYLTQNYPNPFNPSTEIAFNIPRTAYVQLKIFDVLGRETATLVNEFLSAGVHTARWSPNNAPSGVYFCQIITDRFVQTKKLVLMK